MNVRNLKHNTIQLAQDLGIGMLMATPLAVGTLIGVGGKMAASEGVRQGDAFITASSLGKCSLQGVAVEDNGGWVTEVTIRYADAAEAEHLAAPDEINIITASGTVQVPASTPFFGYSPGEVSARVDTDKLTPRWSISPVAPMVVTAEINGRTETCGAAGIVVYSKHFGQND